MAWNAAGTCNGVQEYQNARNRGPSPEGRGTMSARTWNVLLLAIMLLLVCLTLLQNCQLDGLENRVIANTDRLDELLQSRRAGDEPPSSAGKGQTTAVEGNLLEPCYAYPLPANTSYGGTLRVSGREPLTLNPYLSKSAKVHEIYTYISSRLAARDSSDPERWCSALATDVQQKDGGRNYIITLRPGVTWQEPMVDWNDPSFDWLKVPHQLVADDFIFALDIITNQQTGGQAAALRTDLDDMLGYEALDPYTISVSFRESRPSHFSALMELKPMPRWLYMHDRDGSPFPRETWGESFSKHWYNHRAIGVGPFRLESWESGETMRLGRNLAYWGPRPAFDTVVIRFGKDPEVQVRRFETGELDVVTVRGTQLKAMESGKSASGEASSHVKRTSHRELSLFYVAWNLRLPLFSDSRVRRAMAMAMNRQRILDVTSGGLGGIPSEALPMQHPCYDSTVQPIPFDKSGAASLLERAGWRDADGDGIREKIVDGATIPLEFSLLFFDSGEWRSAMKIYQHDLLSIGVQMTPRSLPWSALSQRMEDRDFQAFTGYMAYDWAQDMTVLWHSREADRPGSLNRSGLKDPQVDLLTDRLRTLVDPSARNETCGQLHRLINQLQPQTAILQAERAVLYRDTLNPLVFSPTMSYRNPLLWSFKPTQSR